MTENALTGHETRDRTPHERAALGKAARAEVPRSSHAEFAPSQRRADPVDTFAEAYADQNEKDHQALVDAVLTGRVKAEGSEEA